LLTPILPIWSLMPAKVEPTPALPGLSPIGGRPVIARFDGSHMSSDGGLLVLRKVERRLDVAKRLAACLTDPRNPDRVVHGLDEIIRFRLLMERSSASPVIAAGPRAPLASVLRGRQRRRPAAHRPGVQARHGAAWGRGGAVLAADHLAPGEPAQPTRAAADGPGHGRPVLRVVPPGAAPDRARRGRHVRRRARHAAAAFVRRAKARNGQRAPRRVWRPAHRGVRWRGPLRHRSPAPGQAAVGARDPGLPAPPAPRQLAPGRVKLHLPSRAACQAILALVLGRMPRLTC